MGVQSNRWGSNQIGEKPMKLKEVQSNWWVSSCQTGGSSVVALVVIQSNWRGSSPMDSEVDGAPVVKFVGVESTW